MASVSATPARLNVTCVGGDDLNMLVTATWSDGLPVDFSGALLAQVRDHPTSATVRATLECVPGTPATGTVTVSLDAVHTRALLGLGVDPLIPTAYYGYWDLQAVNPSTLQTRTITGGVFNVNIDVARTP